jgi:3-hydroxyacyl-CoA dehydrogenase
MESLVLFPRRLSEAQEVADAIVFLLKNSMMNDTVIKVDGGWRNMSTWGGAPDPRKAAISLE